MFFLQKPSTCFLPGNAGACHFTFHILKKPVWLHLDRCHFPRCNMLNSFYNVSSLSLFVDATFIFGHQLVWDLSLFHETFSVTNRRAQVLAKAVTAVPWVWTWPPAGVLMAVPLLGCALGLCPLLRIFYKGLRWEVRGLRASGLSVSSLDSAYQWACSLLEDFTQRSKEQLIHTNNILS